MKNSVTRKLSSAKSFAAAILFAAVALAFACGLVAVPVQAAIVTETSTSSGVKKTWLNMELGESMSFKTSDYSKVESDNSKVLKVTKKSGKYVVKAKKIADEPATLSFYEDGKLTENYYVSVMRPYKLICIGKSASYKTSVYSKVVSGNSKILTVTKKSGKYVVKAKKAGKTTLKLYKKGKLSKTIDVITKKASAVKADTSAKTLKVGKKFTWKPKSYSSVMYSVSDSSILSVSASGVCKAKKPGKVTVTMKLYCGASTFKTYKKKVTVKALTESEKTVVKKTVNVPIAGLAAGYNKTYINNKNITMLENQNDETLIYYISSKSLYSVKITGDAAELGTVTTSITDNGKKYTCTNSYSLYDPYTEATEIFIETKSPGKAVLTAEDYTHIYQTTLNVIAMSNKSDGTLYTGWVDSFGWPLNPDKAGVNLIGNDNSTEDNNTAALTHLVYKGRFAKTTEEMQAAAKVNCTPIKKFLESENWDDLSEFDKADAVVIYICKTAEYDLNGTAPGSWTGVFYEGKAVCSGFSDATSICCKLVGLEVIQLNGAVVDTEDGNTTTTGHEWAVVKINGKWYNADIAGDWMCSSKYPVYEDEEHKTTRTTGSATEMKEGLIEYKVSIPTYYNGSIFMDDDEDGHGDNNYYESIYYHEK